MLSRHRFLEALAMFPAMQTKMANVSQIRKYSVTSSVKPQEFSDNTTTTTDEMTNTIHDLSLDEQKQNEEEKVAKQNAILNSSIPLRRSSSSSTTTIPVDSNSFERVLPLSSRLSMMQNSSSHGFLPTRKPSLVGNARLGGSTRRLFQQRRSSVSESTMSIEMTFILTEISTLTEDLSRNQSILETRMMKLKSEMDALQQKRTSPFLQHPGDQKTISEADDSTPSSYDTLSSL
jgi:hypothetical protein